MDKLPLAGLSYLPSPHFLSFAHPATNPSVANFIPGISPRLVVYLVIFLGGETVKYGLILLIIGLIQLGWTTFEPPTFLPHVYSIAENITLRVFFGGRGGLLQQWLCWEVTAAKVWRWTRKRHRALVVPAGQCKLFSFCIKEKATSLSVKMLFSVKAHWFGGKWRNIH